jgi:hypothetical protein
MKLAVISMIRDEADIIGSFLRHLAALFDLVFLLDQRSSDGTSEVIEQACRARPGWSHWRMDFSGRHQKEVTTLFMGRAFEAGADAVFFLDCDEFVDVQSRADLEAATAHIIERAVPGVFSWKACVPLRLDRWPFNPRDKLWIAGRASKVWKIAVPKTLAAKSSGLGIAQGSHRVVDRESNAIRGGIPIGNLLHLPVRSRQQFLQKVFNSAFANLAKNNPMTHEGRHKRNFLEVIAKRELTDMALTAIGAQFPMLDTPPQWWTTTREIKRAGYTKARLTIPFAELALPVPPRPDLARIIARSLLEYRLEDIAGGDGSLVLDGNTVRFQPAPG